MSKNKALPAPHQNKAINDIIEAFKENNRVTAIMACATGKTLVALWVAEELKAKTILVLVPSLALIKQLADEWLFNANYNISQIMGVCSDNAISNYDDLTINKCKLRCPVTTSSLLVREFLQSKTDAIKIVFATYHSSSVVADAINGDFAFDFCFFDEAHKTALAEDSGSGFTLALLDKYISIKKRLFMTATPRYSSIRRNGVDVSQAYSMDDNDTYGPVAHNLSFREAVEQGIICDYKIIVSVVSSKMMLDNLCKDENTQEAATRIAISMAIKELSIQKTITYHSTISQALRFSQSLKSSGSLGGIAISHINGGIQSRTRQKIMNKFRQSQSALLTNARCLIEGVDVADIDMVVFVSKKESKIDIVQAVGRAMRKNQSAAKKVGYVLIPLFLDQENNEPVSSAFHRSGYGAIIDILNAMQEYDSNLMSYISDFKMDYASKPYNSLNPILKIIGDIGDLEALKNVINIRIIDAFYSAWDDSYTRLKIYKQTHGHCNVPQRYSEDKTLGQWAHLQRKLYKNDQLQDKRKRLLEEIGLIWDPLDAEWNKNFGLLKVFKEKYGHCNVSQNFTDGKDLSQWVSVQRGKFQQNKIPDSRKILLEDIGFIWNVFKDKWYVQYEKLVKFKGIHGHCNVPNPFIEDKTLGTWVSIQRKYNKNNKMSQENKDLLEKIGFTWVKIDKVWDNNFRRLEKFSADHGHCNVPQRWGEDKELAIWVGTLRKRLQNNRLSDERKIELARIGFIINPLEHAWQNNFQKLQNFKNEHGHCNVPQKWEGDKKLATWVINVKISFKKGKLSKDRQELLNKIGFVWDISEEKWQENFRKLQDFQTIHGHCIVPYNNIAIGKWLNNQQKTYRKGRLIKEKLDLLQSIGVVFKN